MDGSYDEVFAAPGQPRAHASALAGALAELGPDALADAGRMRDSIFMQQGITFDAGGPDADGPVRDRPFPLDLVPRIIPGEEWRRIKRGLAQRIRALNAFVDDVYHGREIVHEGIVPWELVVSRSAFARAAHGIRPPGGVYCHVSGCDLVRDADGSWKVLEDNVRTPSGISYVLENRVAMTRLLPGLFGSYRVRPVDQYPALLRAALTEVAPTSAEEEATVVVWTPARSTPPTSSTRSSRARWASSWSRRRTSWSGTPPVTSGPPTACSASTRSTAASTTTSWIRSSSGRTRCSAFPG